MKIINDIYKQRLINKSDKNRYHRKTWKDNFWFQTHLHYYFLDHIIYSQYMYNYSHIYYMQDGYLVKGFYFPPNGEIKELKLSSESNLNSYYLDKQSYVFIGFKYYNLPIKS